MIKLFGISLKNTTLKLFKNNLFFYRTVLMLFLAFVSVEVWGATRTWTGGGGNTRWTTTNNWSGSTLPADGDDVIIPAGFNVTISRVPDRILNSLSVSSNIIFTANGTATTLSINNISGATSLTVASGCTLTLGGGNAGNAVNLNLQALNTASTVAGTLSMAAYSTIDCGTNLISGTGSFTLAANATLITANTAGISALGTATGSIRTTTARTFNAGANYIYNGSSTQATGTGLPTTISGILTINNSTVATGVTLSQATTVSGSFTNNGIITAASTNTLTLSGTSVNN